jgi:hypothetical protein
MAIVSAKQVKAIAKEHGKRVSPEFIKVLDRHVVSLVEKACNVHDGNRKTLTVEILGFMGIAGE